ncbi:hypothetical protein [Maribacter sp. ACAM166]|uniref:hypothetical protein n=1 Tax=Maribacter sp. ACAM166 TaxID=2508996 RepID=UPI0010FE0822|nr:hypothetical protein [Maribacter sp. ACAM166]TLP74368.1 hypothetical protein ES765_15990 [Maribacter sp. ACAM166]
MSIRIGDEAPELNALTTADENDLHQELGHGNQEEFIHLKSLVPFDRRSLSLVPFTVLYFTNTKFFTWI